ncbi:MAG: hypothetical protein ACK5MG_08075 [Bacteroidales bacterium]
MLQFYNDERQINERQYEEQDDEAIPSNKEQIARLQLATTDD